MKEMTSEEFYELLENIKKRPGTYWYEVIN